MNKESDKESIDPLTGLIKFPQDYLDLFNLIQPSAEDITTAEDQIKRNKFFKWLNDKRGPFYHAKQQMIKNGLLLPENFLPTTQGDFLAKYRLEYFCTECIYYFATNREMLQQVPALKPNIDKIKKAMNKIKEVSETTGIVSFENTITYHVLLKSIDILLASNKKRSIYSTGKIYPEIGRELMFKRLVESLYRFCLSLKNANKITDHFIKNTALEITDNFFDTRVATDPINIVLKIKSNVIGQIKLWDMPIKEFLA